VGFFKFEIRNSKFEIVTLLILPAAGTGARLGRSEPKALVPILGRPILFWTLDALSSISFDRVVVAAPPDRTAEFEKLLRGRAAVVAGGPTRSSSVRRGFEACVAGPSDIVCIHDAGRPLILPEEAKAVLAAAEASGAATAATPIVDTVKRVEGERIVATIDREGLYAAGTPQAFRADLLRRAFDTGREATDEAGLFEMLGLPVTCVPVSRWNLKITTEEDLELAEALLKRRAALRSPELSEGR
jgi:2-C-methyl-D-erythritol 4-phosphate cytidylyltransferase